MRTSSSGACRNVLPFAAVLLLGGSVTGAEAAPSTYSIGTCTIASPARHAVINVEIANARDFCELVSQALGSEVFHSPLIVTFVEWTSIGLDRSCELQFRQTKYRLTVWDAPAACSWFTRPATGWHRIPTAAL